MPVSKRRNFGQSALAPVQGWSVCSLQKPSFKWRLGEDGFVPNLVVRIDSHDDLLNGWFWERHFKARVT